ncbi:MAG TPA: amidohydrolase family protein [Pyrinomonadaceae bacterium]|jgi:imidazolonepropionase-like amidohydrolase|nr:amidohydrolase family protein [Pyrinomonadaceae bacterium]
MKKLLFLLFALACAAAPTRAQEQRTVAYTGATVINATGQTINDGVLVVRAGKIVAVGPRSTTRVPEGAQVLDVTGKTIMPGIVDTHSHIGGGAGADGSAPIQPDVRIFDAVNVRDTSLMRARAGGITTVNIMPGSGHLLSGQTVYIKLRRGSTIEDLAIRDAAGNLAGGIKMANGTNPLRANSTGPFPGTRAREASLVREQFVRAQDYREKVRRAGGDKTKLPPRDLALEALVEALDGKRVVHFHTHRHDDILTAIRLSKEFGFRVVLHHVTEGWKVADEIARAGVPASITVVDSPGGKLEAVDARLELGAALDRAGVLLAIHTDDYITDSRLLLRSAALAVRGGLPREKAVYALTLAGARMLDLQDRTGSLEAGKDADFIVLSGDPFSVYTHVLETYVEGVKVFDRSDKQDKLYATGGYGAGYGQHLDFECYAETEGGSQR